MQVYVSSKETNRPLCPNVRHHSLLYKRKISILLFLIAICILPCKVLCNKSITNLWRVMKYIPICTCVSDNTKILNDVLFHILQSSEQKFFKQIQLFHCWYYVVYIRIFSECLKPLFFFLYTIFREYLKTFIDL